MQGMEAAGSWRFGMNPMEHPGARHRIFPELLTHLWLACLAPGLQCDLGIRAFQRLLRCCREMWNTGNARAGWMPGSRALGEAGFSWIPMAAPAAGATFPVEKECGPKSLPS